MSANLVINGVTYAFPATGDENWGDTVSAWAAAVSSSLLQKTGGLFTLSAEADFGALFGIKSLYFKSRGTNPATAGIGRFANNEFLNWRNAANSANLALGVNASDQLTYDGAVLTTVASLSNNRAVVTDGTGTFVSATTTATEIGYVNGVTSAIQTQLDGKQATGNYITALTGHVVASGPGSVAATIQAGVITNAMINASAAIAYSKLALTGSIVNADVSTSAAIARSKLALPNYWQGVTDGGVEFYSTSSSYADPTSRFGTPAITQTSGNGITVTQAASNLPGITFTPSSAAAVYLISATFSSVNSATAGNCYTRLTDGTTPFAWCSPETATGAYYLPNTLMGIFVPGTASAVTVKIEMSRGNNSGTATIAPPQPNMPMPAIVWSIVQIGG